MKPNTIKSLSVLLRMKNVSDKICRENQSTHLCSKTNFYSVYEIIWKNMIEPDRPQMKIWHVCISGWIAKDKSTHSGYLIFIAFPLQYCLHEKASVLTCTWVACRFFIIDYWKISRQ